MTAQNTTTERYVFITTKDFTSEVLAWKTKEYLKLDYFVYY